MLKAPSLEPGVVFSSPRCLPEVEWADALSFKVGAFRKKLIPVLHTPLRKSDPSSQCTKCSVLRNNPKRSCLSGNHRGNQTDIKKYIYAEILQDEGSFVVRLTGVSVWFELFRQVSKELTSFQIRNDNVRSGDKQPIKQHNVKYVFLMYIGNYCHYESTQQPWIIQTSDGAQSLLLAMWHCRYS